jgi:hypothetical protein
MAGIDAPRDPLMRWKWEGGADLGGYGWISPRLMA